MSKWLLVSCVILLACGNPHITEGDPDDLFEGRPPVQTDPDDPSGPDDPPPPGSVVVDIPAEALHQEDLGDLKLPYKKHFKAVPLGTTRKSIFCPKKHRQHCTWNTQTLFRFDLSEVKYLTNKFRVRQVTLTGDYYSIGTNFRTELLCNLEYKICSGRGILKWPVWLVKILSWDKGFWSNGYESTVTSPVYQDQLDADWNKEEKIFMTLNKSWALRRLFNIPREEVETMIAGRDHLSFVVTDDTFVENISLRIVLEEK